TDALVPNSTTKSALEGNRHNHCGFQRFFSLPLTVRNSLVGRANGKSRSDIWLQPAVVAWFTPIHLWQHDRRIHAVAILEGDIHEGIKKGLREIVGLQTQIKKLGMLRVVIVLFRFDAWIRDVVNFYFHPKIPS